MLCRSHFTVASLAVKNQDTVRAIISWLTANDSALARNTMNSELRRKFSVKSPAGIHYTFSQNLNGIEIYSSQVKVNLDKNGNIRSWFDNTFPEETISSLPFPDEKVALEVVKRRYPFFRYVKLLKHEKIYFPHINGNGAGIQPVLFELIPAILITINDSSENNYELVINESGNILFENDLNRYLHKKTDSTVTATVFLPDPLTTAQSSYGSPYIDANDADIQELNDQRKTVSVNTAFGTDNYFRLESIWVKIDDFSSPNKAPASVSTPSFNFTRSDDFFEDVNVYYHINTFQEHIRSLGFTNLAAYQVQADAHALSGQDNSIYSSGQLSFGEGGVDDAEDADVIIHEYGHAVSESAAPGTLSGIERLSLDEAFGDYLASSYSRSLDEFGWEKVFSWDGHNEFWPGRWSVSNKCYPDNVTTDYYQFADIWSSTVMQIWSALGRMVTDRLMLQSLYSYSGNMSMTDAARLFLQADTLLYGAANSDTILDLFIARGLLGNCSYSSVPEPVLKKAINPVQLQNPVGENINISFVKYGNYTIEIVSPAGQTLLKTDFSGQGNHSVHITHIPSGFFILKISTPDCTQKFKLVKI
ncbi:MAG: T9SS type A sorting domain-containing protein [Bacteroidetes bacterium]|nr:T9SS type A sorting domain-containing protein [Bacteroidota bacterium]